MNVAAHITFFYVENRLGFLESTISNLLSINEDVTIFIYSNTKFDITKYGKNVFLKTYNYTKEGNKNYSKFKSTISQLFNSNNNIHPYYLAWESRHIIYKNRLKFDAQIYIEDDITFNQKNFSYWLKHKEECLKNNYNLGFLRYEVDGNNKYFATDLLQEIKNTIVFDKNNYLVNDNNPYCGFMTKKLC